MNRIDKMTSWALTALLLSVATIYVLADSWSPGGKIAQNTVLAGSNGAGNAAPAPRQIVNGDITNTTIDLTTKVTGILPPANGGTGVNNGTFNLTVPATGTACLNDVASTISAVKTFSLTPLNSTQDLTAGTMTQTNKSNIRTVIHRYDWTNAMITALGATGTGDILVCTLPSKTVVRNVYVVLLTADTSANALTVAVGRAGGTNIDYIVASDAKAGANIVYGDTAGERGTNLTGYDLPTYASTTSVNAHFIKTATNLSTVLNCTGCVYIETYILP